MIDCNGKDTMLILAVRSNILCYNLIEKQFICSFEGHANNIAQLKFMDYSIDQKKDMDSVKREYLISTAQDQNFANVWKITKKENNKIITAPEKMLEMIDNKAPIGLQMKQIAGHFYFATITTQFSLRGYV